MVESTAYLVNMGVEYIHFEPVNIAGRAAYKGSKVQRPNVENFANAIINCSEIVMKANAKIIIPSIMSFFHPSYYKCDGLSGRRISISPNGILSRCLEVQDFKHPLSDIMQIGTYNIQNGEVSISFNNKLDVWQKTFSNRCRVCNLRFICSNGCPSRNYHNMGSFKKIDEFQCVTTKLLSEYVMKKLWDKTSKKGYYRLVGDIRVWDVVLLDEFLITPNKNMFSGIPVGTYTC